MTAKQTSPISTPSPQTVTFNDAWRDGDWGWEKQRYLLRSSRSAAVSRCGRCLLESRRMWNTASGRDDRTFWSTSHPPWFSSATSELMCQVRLHAFSRAQDKSSGHVLFVSTLLLKYSFGYICLVHFELPFYTENTITLTQERWPEPTAWSIPSNKRTNVIR